MTPANLKDILTARRGKITLDEIRKSPAYRDEDNLTECKNWLLDVGLILDHGDSLQAVRGYGKPVEKPTSIKVEVPGQRPMGQLPRMSERCQAGGLQNGINRRARQDEIIERVIERLRSGIPRKLLADITPSRMHLWKTTRPDDYRRILEAAGT